MGAYNGTIQNFIQGVSQQSQKQRIEGQLELQENCVSSILKGLTRRNGCRYLSETGIHGSGTFYYTYNRGDGKEKYLFILFGGILFVYNLETGEQVSVDNADYLFSYFSDIGSIPKFFTVGDTTFVVNTKKTVSMSDAKSTSLSGTYLLYLKKASYGITYEVFAYDPVAEEDIQIATFTTDSVVTIASERQDKTLYEETSEVLEELASQIEDWFDTAYENLVTVETEKGVIKVTSDSDLRVNVSDTNGNQELFCVHDEIKSYDDLPPVAPDDFKVKVLGNDTSDWNDYYVKFVADSSDSVVSTGNWKETLADDIYYNFLLASMPCKIKRLTDGTFEISDCSWVPRDAGDDISNPSPSFIGKAITDIKFYQDRLVLSTNNSVCASVTGDYFNFFSDSVISSSNADPIDVSSSDNKVTDIQHMITFNGSLVIFSKQGQYFHPYDQPFDSDHFALVPKSHFSTEISARPQASAINVFVPFNLSNYVGIRVLDVNNLTGNIKGTKVTHHVEEYIPGSCLQIETSEDHAYLFIRCSGKPNSLFVYQWYYQGDEIKQQAWHEWTFSEVDSIDHISIIDDILYMHTTTSDVGTMYSLDFQFDYIKYTDKTFYLDYYDLIEGTGYTSKIEYTLPNIPVLDYDYKIMLSGAFEEEGKILESSDYDISGNTLSVYTTAATPKPDVDLYIYIGTFFSSKIQLTNPVIKDYKGQPINRGTLRYKDFRFQLEDTGYIDVTVIKFDTYYNFLFDAEDVLSNVFDAKLINSYTLDSYNTLNYIYHLPVRARADSTTIQIESGKHLPFNLVAAEWSGNYREKGRRI
jgi:hypothetical protein